MSRILILPTLFAALSLPYVASASESCESFVAYSPNEKRMASYVTAKAEGPGPGDKLVGFRELTDADGDRRGALHWIADVHSVDQQGFATDKTLSLVVVLNDGVIFAFDEATAPVDGSLHATSTVQHPPEGEIVRIVGGTDAYADVSGTLTMTNEEEGNRYRFDISCEG